MSSINESTKGQWNFVIPSDSTDYDMDYYQSYFCPVTSQTTQSTTLNIWEEEKFNELLNDNLENMDELFNTEGRHLLDTKSYN
jgi:hypothetical protein